MSKKIAPKFSSAKQKRSEKTLDELMQAALIIAEEADLKNFNSRKLSEKSGYSLGTLVKRLGSVENIFLWAVKKIREKYTKEYVQQIKDIDKNLTLDAALERIIDKLFIIFKKVNVKTIQYFEDRMFKKHGFVSDFYDYTDVGAIEWVKTAKNNKTNTFRQMSEDEAIILFRMSRTLIERPFVEGKAIAGTERHRKIIIENLRRLFKK
jgi:hypothetical protein